MFLRLESSAYLGNRLAPLAISSVIGFAEHSSSSYPSPFWLNSKATRLPRPNFNVCCRQRRGDDRLRCYAEERVLWCQQLLLRALRLTLTMTTSSPSQWALTLTTLSLVIAHCGHSAHIKALSWLLHGNCSVSSTLSNQA